MDSILKRLQEPQNFDAFVNDYMKTSTYKALWKNEITQVDYCAARVYQQTLAEYQAAIAGSVIAKNGELYTKGTQPPDPPAPKKEEKAEPAAPKAEQTEIQISPWGNPVPKGGLTTGLTDKDDEEKKADEEK